MVSGEIMTPTETETKTNGYANFETWLTAHYLGNVRTYYFRIRDRFEVLAKTKTDRDEIRFSLAADIRDLLTEILAEDRERSTLSPIGSHYLGHLTEVVDYNELAEAIISDDETARGVSYV